MADVNFPVTWNLPLSGAVNQSFPWTNIVTVNLGQSSNPEIEQEVLSIASYGKQLGRIGDALIVLLRHLPADIRLNHHERRAIADLKAMLREIADAKQRKNSSFVMSPDSGDPSNDGLHQTFI